MSTHNIDFMKKYAKLPLNYLIIKYAHISSSVKPLQTCTLHEQAYAEIKKK